MIFDVTASIVLFKNDPAQVDKAIDSFLNTSLSVQLMLIDNSPDDSLRILKRDQRVTYSFNNKNLGYGKAHNLALRKALLHSRYHLVLNPDVFFEKGTLEQLVVYCDQNHDVGQLMPKIEYPDGETQYLCKLLPTPFDLIFRRFLGFLPIAKKRNEIYELRKSGYNRIMNVPYLSGCFMFFRISALLTVGLFDERIFMYIEDADLTRRMHQEYKTVFYPLATARHHYAKGSYKNLKLMFYNIHGALIYFTKWGWFFDRERKKINRTVIHDYL